MWWTDQRARRALTGLTLAAATVGVCACSTAPLTAGAGPTALTPTEQYTVQVERVPDQLALAPHATGLSENQRAAVAGFIGRWRESGRAEISIRTPADGDVEAVDRVTADLLIALEDSGATRATVRVAPYDTQGAPGAPILASFQRYEARGPNCEGGWDNWTSTARNEVTAHFGCANVANFAAMVADPRDLISPAPSQPRDPMRRATVLQKYRAGEITSTARDSQAAGVVSSAVN